MGVEIVDSIEILLGMVDVVLLETIDGRPHYEQALPVLKAGKPMFIDKPMAANLKGVTKIFATAKDYNCPIFRSEEHTSELQSLMRISYAVFCLKKKH